MTSSQLNHFSQAPLPKTLGVGLQDMDLEGHEYSVPSKHSGSELLSLGPAEHVFLPPQTSLATGSLLYMGSTEANGV